MHPLNSLQLLEAWRKTYAEYQVDAGTLEFDGRIFPYQVIDHTQALLPPMPEGKVFRYFCFNLLASYADIRDLDPSVSTVFAMSDAIPAAYRPYVLRHELKVYIQWPSENAAEAPTPRLAEEVFALYMPEGRWLRASEQEFEDVRQVPGLLPAFAQFRLEYFDTMLILAQAQRDEFEQHIPQLCDCRSFWHRKCGPQT